MECVRTTAPWGRNRVACATSRTPGAPKASPEDRCDRRCRNFIGANFVLPAACWDPPRTTDVVVLDKFTYAGNRCRPLTDVPARGSPLT